jgi:hypothetical protein
MAQGAHDRARLDELALENGMISALLRVALANDPEN